MRRRAELRFQTGQHLGSAEPSGGHACDGEAVAEGEEMDKALQAEGGCRQGDGDGRGSAELNAEDLRMRAREVVGDGEQDGSLATID